MSSERAPDGMTSMRGIVFALAAMTSTAHAEESRPIWYAAGMVSHVQPDADRDMRNGLGGAAVLGMPIGGGFNVEGARRTGQLKLLDARKTGSRAIGAGVDLAFVPHRKGMPFVLVGGGAVHEEGVAPFVRAGLGFDVPNFYHGFDGPLSTRRSTWSLRVDLSWYGTLTDRVNAGEKRLDDVRLNIGFQFNRVPPHAAPPPPKAPIVQPAPAPLPVPGLAPPADQLDIVPPVDWYITYPKEPIPPCALEPMRDEHGFGYVDCRGKPFHVLGFDNGPDYFSEGRVRFEEHGRIGYRDETGAIVIPAQFEHAWPFCGGVARVASACTRTPDGEHTRIECAETHYVDRDGHPVDPPAQPLRCERR